METHLSSLCFWPIKLTFVNGNPFLVFEHFQTLLIYQWLEGNSFFLFLNVLLSFLLSLFLEFVLPSDHVFKVSFWISTVLFVYFYALIHFVEEFFVLLFLLHFFVRFMLLLLSLSFLNDLLTSLVNWLVWNLLGNLLRFVINFRSECQVVISTFQYSYFLVSSSLLISSRAFSFLNWNAYVRFSILAFREDP